MPAIPNPRNIPFSLQDLRSEFDRLLDRVWHVGLSTAPLDGQDWAPSIDVFEESAAYRVFAEVPGVAVDAVEVSILNNVLIIKGTKPAPVAADEKRRCLRAESRFGGFCRRYELPGPARDEAVTASYKNGMLEIVVPKAAEVMGSKVKITSQD